MEELIGFALQCLFEFIIEVFFGAVAEDRSKSASKVSLHPNLSRLLWFSGGGVVGGLSLLVFPQGALHHDALRIANLVAAPLASGLLAAWLQGKKRRAETARPPLDAFWVAALFTFGLVLVRYVFADVARG